MSAYTAGREHHATPQYALAWAKGTARFAFPNRKWKGLQQHQTTTATTTKTLSDSFWDHSSPAFGNGLLSQELVLIKKKLAAEKLLLVQVTFREKKM